MKIFGIAFLTILFTSMTMIKSEETRIRHTVVFKLKHGIGSKEEQAFFDASQVLISIPGVENFEMLVQVSTKNEFDYGFSMEFANQDAYDFYNQHPDHVDYVKNIWKKNVLKFMEIDYVAR